MPKEENAEEPAMAEEGDDGPELTPHDGEVQSLNSLAKEARKLLALSGEVTKSKRFGICVSFQHEGKAQVAGLIPGRAYVNGTGHLLDMCKSDQELTLLFPKGLKVNFDCVECERPAGKHGLKHKQASCHDSVDDEKGGNVSYAWRITSLWFFERPPSECVEDNLAVQEESFGRRMSAVADRVVSDDPTSGNPGENVALDVWFVSTVPLWPLPHPDAAVERGAPGTVESLILPMGGILFAQGKRIFFHRARAFVDSGHLSATANLRDTLSPGMAVFVDYSPLSHVLETSPNIRQDCPAGVDHVALLVYTPRRPQLSKLLFEQNQLNYAKSVRQPYYIARMMKFDPPGPTGTESGVAELVKVPAGTVSPFQKRILKSPENSTYVRFNREKLFHLGACLENADLRYFFHPGMHGMDLFYCYIRELPADEVTEFARSSEASEEKTDSGPSRTTSEPQDVKDEEGTMKTNDQVEEMAIERVIIRQEVTLGWKSTMSFQHSTGIGSHASTASNPDATLLFPPVHSFNSVKLFARELLDVATYERIIEGKMPPLEVCTKGTELAADEEAPAMARVEDLFPPYKKQTFVHYGFVQVASGPHAGRKAFIYRKDCTAFGFSLEDADLQLFFSQNDPVYVRLISHETNKLRASEAWIGWPRDPDQPQSFENLSPERRYKLLLWLEAHSMNINTFKKALKGLGPVRQFIPFRREENKGTVIQLKRADNNGPKSPGGATGGIIKVESGPLSGELVQFIRKFTWVLGFNLRNADLTHIFVEGQKVSLEAMKLKEQEGKKLDEYQGIPIRFRATLVWTSKFIPRSDIQKTVPESPSVNSWLKKRGLTYDKFKLLVRGELPLVRRSLATQNKSNMLKGDQHVHTSGKDNAGPSIEQDTSTLAVFRHGHDAVKVCDRALGVAGPDDPKLKKLIQTDDQAQIAFHIHKALGIALENYKAKRGLLCRSRHQPSTPMLHSQHQRSQDPFVQDTVVHPTMNTFLPSHRHAQPLVAPQQTGCSSQWATISSSAARSSSEAQYQPGQCESQSNAQQHFRDTMMAYGPNFVQNRQQYGQNKREWNSTCTTSRTTSPGGNFSNRPSSKRIKR